MPRRQPGLISTDDLREFLGSFLYLLSDPCEKLKFGSEILEIEFSRQNNTFYTLKVFLLLKCFKREK